MTDVEKYEISFTVGNGNMMKCELKGSVNMKSQDGKMVNITKVMYVTQAVKTLLRISRLVSKGAMMGATQDIMTTKKNGVSVILDARKIQNRSMMFYLKAKRYSSEGQEAVTNMSEDKKTSTAKKRMA